MPIRWTSTTHPRAHRSPRVAGPFVAAIALLVAALAAPLRAQHAAPPHDYTQADVDFVQGMILHHAQAVVMSDWAASHRARPDLQTLCKRIALSQRDEIAMMQHWLQERHLAVPDPLHMLPHGDSTAGHDMGSMSMPGMDMGAHPMLMPGMLTPAELQRLDASRGAAFDRLYLTGMIRHHEGALGMVAKLFATPGAGQQPDLFSFATDVDASQRAEIARMEAILDTLTPSQPQ